MKKKCSAVLAFLCLCAVAGEENLFVNGKAVKGGALPMTGAGLTIAADPVQAGAWCFEAAPGRYIGTDLIPIEPGCAYEVSGRFRGGKECGRFVFGFSCFDAGKKPIAEHHIHAVPGTFTALAAPAVKGENSILIKDGEAWRKIAGRIAVFHAKSDLSDLPNRFTQYYISSVTKEGEAWKVTFTKPLARKYPAGTGVRMHREGSALNAFAFIKPGEAWKEYRTVILPEAVGAPIHRNFWQGTRFVKIHFYVYPGDRIQCGDFVLRKVPVPAKPAER